MGVIVIWYGFMTVRDPTADNVHLCLKGFISAVELQLRDLNAICCKSKKFTYNLPHSLPPPSYYHPQALWLGVTPSRIAGVPSDGGELVLTSRLLLPTIPSSQSQSRRSSNFPYAGPGHNRICSQRTKGCVMGTLFHLFSTSLTETDPSTGENNKSKEEENDFATTSNTASQKHFQQLQHIRGA
ncbi:hypothetical protein CFP56_003352 [Quercus suber]|uniref:Uncharacterized protein n=1 Tax=Quercus suber TaxID=58331 RepID=A0AAW0IJL7_QUESU